jgi:predicted amidohydrolase
VSAVSLPLFFFAAVAPTAEPQQPSPALIKVAAVQMLGYDKTDKPRPGFDPSEAVVRYIEKAAKDQAQLVVFPEYLLGRIPVPGPQTERISQAAASGRIYVIVKSAIFQNEVALIATNQSYGAGTMIGQWPARIMAACPEPKESYITATINLAQVRQARKNSRNLQQRRPELYTGITDPLPPASGSASEGRRSP